MLWVDFLLFWVLPKEGNSLQCTPLSYINHPARKRTILHILRARIRHVYMFQLLSIEMQPFGYEIDNLTIQNFRTWGGQKHAGNRLPSTIPNNTACLLDVMIATNGHSCDGDQKLEYLCPLIIALRWSSVETIASWLYYEVTVTDFWIICTWSQNGTLSASLWWGYDLFSMWCDGSVNSENCIWVMALSHFG